MNHRPHRPLLLGRGEGTVDEQAEPVAGPAVEPIVSYLSITQHYDDFTRGVLDTTHLVFYLSFIAFGLFLTAKSVDSERWRG